MTLRRVEVGERTVSVFLLTEDLTAPLLYVLGEEMSGDLLSQGLQGQACHLAMLGGFSWHRDLTPWPRENPFQRDQPFTGGAEAWLRLVEDELLPDVEQALQLQPCWRALAGYSLGGLFALWQACHSQVFQRLASVSGSLWYEGFLDYLSTRPLRALPQRAYFSYGDKEAQTRLPGGQNLAELTARAEEYLRLSGTQTRLDINPGNHFVDSLPRLQKALIWLLS